MKRFDWTIGFGVVIGTAAIGFGAWLDGLNLGFLWNGTAFLIIGGGTLGAVIVRRGGSGLMSAVKAVWGLRLKDSEDETHRVEIARLAWLSRSAQKSGVKVYESYAETSRDPLISNGLLFVAENTEVDQMEQFFARMLDEENEKGSQDAATLEAAGGFAPTFGILGAVLGLIGVLRVIDKPEVLGIGIATAFIATIYGIGSANILFFPLAARLRQRNEAAIKRRTEIADVILALRNRQNPQAIIQRFGVR